jgi:hypothetical protein
MHSYELVPKWPSRSDIGIRKIGSAAQDHQLLSTGMAIADRID